MTPLEIALDYVRRGWSPVPVPFKQKGPVIPGWQNLRIDEENAAAYFNHSTQNIGVVLGPRSGGLTDVDLDCAEALALADHFLPTTQACFGRRSRPRSHRLYRTELSETEKKATLTFKDPETGDMLVEVRIGGDSGAQTVFPGSVHPSDEKIEWAADGEPAKVDGENLKGSVSVLAAASLLARHWPGEGSRHEAALVLGGFLARWGTPSPFRAADLVELVAEVAGDDELSDRRRAAEDAAAQHERGGNVYGLPKLKEVFGEKVANAVAEWLEYAPDADPGVSEDALALLFADRHAAKLRYVAAWGRWMIYDGARWRRDETLLAYDLVREICREEANKARSPRLVDAIKRAQTVAAVEKLARADRRIAASADQWDADPWLLNTPGWVVDLRTGRMRAHDPADYMTKLTAVTPGGDCPLFDAHLRMIMKGNEALISYLWRLFGYSCTGLTNEESLAFFWGEGANGKTKTIKTIAGILGDYHQTTAMETLTASKFDRHPTEIADLHGARLVTASETEEGRRWAEARIKQMTGGDRLKARFMRQDFFEFDPQFNLIITGNHKPRLRSVDEATKRRFQLVPFTYTIPEEERDIYFEEKLRKEWSGILAKMIQGALEWQKQRLNPPEEVLTLTEEYFEEEDTVLQWFRERSEARENVATRSSDAYADYKTWAEDSGEHPLSNKAFSQRLERRAEELKIQKVERNIGSVWVGLRLRDASQQARDRPPPPMSPDDYGVIRILPTKDGIPF
jgi:P4 family phage/plasmid primase-like protien